MQASEAKIIPIIFKQETCVREVFCGDCHYTGEELLPTSMKIQNVQCRGCGKTGFMDGWRKRR